jgi:hypothetical protein
MMQARFRRTDDGKRKPEGKSKDSGGSSQKKEEPRITRITAVRRKKSEGRIQ